MLLPQNTRVSFILFNENGEPIIYKGKIVGLSTQPRPKIGAGYIVEPDVKILNHAYSHICLFGFQLKIQD